MEDNNNPWRDDPIFGSSEEKTQFWENRMDEKEGDIT